MKENVDSPISFGIGRFTSKNEEVETTVVNFTELCAPSENILAHRAWQKISDSIEPKAWATIQQLKHQFSV